MGLSKYIGEIFGKSAGGAITGLAGAIDRFVETPEEKEAARILRAKMQAEPDKMQAEINKVEAAHPSIFVAGWRPFCGWVCGIGLAWHFIVFPTVQWIVVVWKSGMTLPAIQTEQLITLLFGMLGMGAYRTYEKHKNAEGNR